MTRFYCLAFVAGMMLVHTGCSSNEATVTTPDKEFYENLKNTPLDSSEEAATGLKPKG